MTRKRVAEKYKAIEFDKGSIPIPRKRKERPIAKRKALIACSFHSEDVGRIHPPRRTRNNPAGNAAKKHLKKTNWMGSYVAVVSLMIAFKTEKISIAPNIKRIPRLAEVGWISDIVNLPLAFFFH